MCSFSQTFYMFHFHSMFTCLFLPFHSRLYLFTAHLNCLVNTGALRALKKFTDCGSKHLSPVAF